MGPRRDVRPLERGVGIPGGECRRPERRLPVRHLSTMFFLLRFVVVPTATGGAAGRRAPRVIGGYPRALDGLGGVFDASFIPIPLRAAAFLARVAPSRHPVSSHACPPIARTAAPQAVKKKYLQLPGTHREPLSSPRYPRLRPGTTTTPNVTRPTATPRPPAATTTSTATSTAAAAAAAAAASSRRSRGWCGRPSSTCAS